MPESKTTEHRAWRNMLDRCYNPRCADFRRYGGRGIKVCDRWNRKGPKKGCGAAYRHFLQDMGRKPTRWHVIDRIDVNGNYSPENCRWVTPEISLSNKRRPLRSSAERKLFMRAVMIPKDLHFKIKLIAAERGMFLEGIMEKMIQGFIQSYENQKQTNQKNGSDS